MSSELWQQAAAEDLALVFVAPVELAANVRRVAGVGPVGDVGADAGMFDLAQARVRSSRSTECCTHHETSARRTPKSKKGIMWSLQHPAETRSP